MKKTSFLLATLALVCAMTTSCTKEENNQTGKDQFYAAVDSSKISMSGTGVTAWSSGDLIKVLGYDETDYSFESVYALASGAGTPSGVFSHDNVPEEWPTPILDHGPYLAFYPCGPVVFMTEIGGYEEESTVYEAYLSFEQSYTGEGLPMFARSETRQLTFSHMLSILKLHIQANTSLRLDHIRVRADKGICGPLPVAYDANGNAYITTPDEWMEGDNIMAVHVGQYINNGLDVYIGLPVGTYSSIQLEMFTDEGPTEGPLVCTKSLSSSFTFERNKLYPVSMENLVFVPYEEPY